MTVKQWIDFMGQAENVVIGLRKNDGLACPLNHYFPADQAKKEFEGWLDEEVINAHPFNLIKNDKQYCLLIY